VGSANPALWTAMYGFSENGCREALTRALAKGPLEVRKDIKEAEARLKVEYHKNIEKEKEQKKFERGSGVGREI